MANSRQSATFSSRSSERPTKRTRSSITEHSFQDIASSPRGGSVTYVSGTNCHPCVGSFTDDSVDLTRLSSLNSIKKRRILDGSWTVLDSIGRCPAKSTRAFLGICCGSWENRCVGTKSHSLQLCQPARLLPPNVDPRFPMARNGL